MAQWRIRRNAATTKGFVRRVEEHALEEIPDPRDSRWVSFPLPGVLKLLVYSLMSGSRSLRSVETRSEQLGSYLEERLGLGERISDNAIGHLLPRLSARLLGAALARGVHAEWRRKGLSPRSLPWSVVSIDGKHLATIPEAALRRLLDDDAANPGSAQWLRTACAARFPHVQVQDGAGGVVGLVRVHNATLVSSHAAVLIHQRPIAGATNEIGAMPDLLRDVFAQYRRSGMLQVIAVDAGNTSRGVAAEIRKRGAHYVMTLAEPHGTIHEEAVRTLAHRERSDAGAKGEDKVNGEVVEHYVWVEDLARGFRPWEHAAQLVRVERVVTKGDGTVTVGNRYFATSMVPAAATPARLLTLVRDRWRVENETHWTHDARWDEDAKRTPWTQHPDAVLVVGILRAIAVNIAAILRALSRYADDPNAPEGKRVWITPTWVHIVETVLMLFFVPYLDTSAFDTATSC